MPFFGPAPIEEALAALGEQLQSRRSHASVIVVGGATLNILGIISRSTTDVDVIALAHRSEDGTIRLERAEPLPPELVDAVRIVGRDFGLPDDWMNSAVEKQWSTGIPPSIDQDLTWRTYGALEVGFVGRRTLIALKLFAAVDQGPKSVHYQDLLRLAPSEEDLQDAARWVETQDASPEFPSQIQQVIANVEHDRENR